MKDEKKFAEVWKKAKEAGLAAGHANSPVPMVVASAIGLSDKADLSKPVYVVADGACGFAWVKVRPGNSAFARWLVKNNYASKAYGGGVHSRISEHNQSISRKEAHAEAMAEVLRNELGINAYAESRLD